MVIISGAPSMAERRRNPLIHHKVRSYDTQFRVFQQLTVGATVLDDPDDACREIDRVLRLCKRQSRPVYIELPRDMVNVEAPSRSHWSTIPSPATAGAGSRPCRGEAHGSIARERPVIFFGVELIGSDCRMWCGNSSKPAVFRRRSTLLDKGAIEEDSPLFLGVYAGALGREDVRPVCRGERLPDHAGDVADRYQSGRSRPPGSIPHGAFMPPGTGWRLGCIPMKTSGLDDFINGLHDCGIGRRESRDFPHADVPQPVAVQCGGADEPITVDTYFSDCAPI